MSALEGKVAIIAGASSGIGWAAARLFAAEGAKVVIGARRKHALDELAGVIDSDGGEAIVVSGDVCDEGFQQDLVDTALERFGGLHVAFNNAGTLGAIGPVPDMTVDDWRDCVEINLTSAFMAAKHQIPAMLQSGAGSLIFTSTFVGKTVGMPGMAAYAAAKSGLVGLTQCLAAEHGPQGLRVNALLPGGTDTPMGRSAMSDPQMLEFVKGMHALKRIATPLEIARAALFLASDNASFVTGSSMLVDGGVSINRT
ncbi:SDR family oxidoreductase [Aestuariispira ectoiniformans]|uniref:SDR family oxidoreductase n=1 Tax=Aestuariispira ectoiniformans TaxID=2775080 RepID=UPI00223C1B7D|nr:SDR family oxidoreductase [Aestuariispira ectoiniformans]